MITFEVEQIQAQLETKQHELQARIAKMLGSSGKLLTLDNEYQSLEDEADEATETQRATTVLETERNLLVAIKAALLRLRQGTYGRCVDCGQPLPEKRLKALPWAARDLQCEMLWEQRLIRR